MSPSLFISTKSCHYILFNFQKLVLHLKQNVRRIWDLCVYSILKDQTILMWPPSYKLICMNGSNISHSKPLISMTQNEFTPIFYKSCQFVLNRNHLCLFLTSLAKCRSFSGDSTTSNTIYIIEILKEVTIHQLLLRFKIFLKRISSIGEYIWKKYFQINKISNIKIKIS